MMRAAPFSILLVALLAGCGGRSADQQTNIGQTHLVLGNIEEAEQAFRSAVEADDSYGLAHLGLARCLSIKGETAEALESYSHAAAVPDAAIAACFEAADIALRSGNSSDAASWAGQLSETNPEHGAILDAYLLRRAGDNTRARSALEKAVTDFGDNSNAALELAWSYAMDRDSANASKLYGSLTTSGANPDQLAMLEAELRVLSSPVAPESKSDVANAWESARRKSFDDAVRAAEPFADGSNATPWANVVLGYCALSQGAPREAQRRLRLASFELPAVTFVRDLLAKTNTIPEQTLADPTTEVAGNPSAWRDLFDAGRLGRLLNNPEQWGDSEEASNALYVAALVSGNVELAEQLAKNLGSNSRFRSYSAAMSTAVHQGQPSDLLELVNDWPAETDRETVLTLNATARAYAVAQLRARALEQILRCLVNAPENGIALYNLATLYREAGMPSHEIEAWRRLLSRHPEHEEAQERVYALLVQYGRFAEARRVAEAAYLSKPNDLASLIRLADGSFKTGDPDFALAALIKNAQTNPTDRAAARALARGFLVVGDGENALRALEDRPDEYDLRAYALALTGAWDDAQTASANDPSVAMLHAALLTRSGEYDEVVSILQRMPLTRASRIWMDALIARTNSDADVDAFALTLGTRADVLADFALGAAYSAGGVAKSALEQWQSTSDTVGYDVKLSTLMLSELARTGAVPEKALAARRIVEQHAASPEVWLGLADVHASMENAKAKTEALNRAATLAVNALDIWQGIAQRLGEQDTALQIEAFQNLFRLLPDDPLVQNNYAYALLQEGKSSPNPLAIAESAFETLGTRSHVLHTLGLALVQAGRIDEAREKLYQALEQRPGDPTLMLDFGKALIAQDEVEEGRGLVEASITYSDRLRVSFPRRDEAERILGEEAA